MAPKRTRKPVQFKMNLRSNKENLESKRTCIDLSLDKEAPKRITKERITQNVLEINTEKRELRIRIEKMSSLENYQSKNTQSSNSSGNSFRKSPLKKTKESQIATVPEKEANKNEKMQGRPRREKRSKPVEVSGDKPQPSQRKLPIVRTNMIQMDNIQLGRIALIKWPSPYPYWPARISSKVGKGYDVTFYGDNSRTAVVKPEKIFCFESNSEYLVKTLRSKTWKIVYGKAVREAEIDIGVNEDKSILNMVGMN